MNRAVWPLLLGLGIAAEVRSLVRHDGATLSECYRLWARTDTPAGRTFTFLGVAALGYWLPAHLCKEIKQ